jgi:multisubunit Na+/H+ antiporter MnhF subunit
MANVALGFGVALLILGIGGYVATGMESPTALIPAAFGFMLIILGILAQNPGRRKMAMHIAVAIGLLGFIGSARGLGTAARMMGGEDVVRPQAAVAQAIMALLCLAFTILCVRSFINARRSGTMEKAR